MPPQPINGPIARDAEDPGQQPAFRAVVQIDPTPHDVESFLDYLFGFVSIAEHAVGNAEEPWSSEVNQLYQGLLIPRQQPIVERGLAGVGQQGTAGTARVGSTSGGE